jgi:hypothetical protein
LLRSHRRRAATRSTSTSQVAYGYLNTNKHTQPMRTSTHTYTHTPHTPLQDRTPKSMHTNTHAGGDDGQAGSTGSCSLAALCASKLSAGRDEVCTRTYFDDVSLLHDPCSSQSLMQCRHVLRVQNGPTSFKFTHAYVRACKSWASRMLGHCGWRHQAYIQHTCTFCVCAHQKAAVVM